MDKKPESGKQDLKGKRVDFSRDQVHTIEISKSRDDVSASNMSPAENPFKNLLKPTQAENPPPAPVNSKGNTPGKK